MKDATPLWSGPIVVMGVSASGKSSFGAALARSLGRDFVDGDALHPAPNIEKMLAGVPLDDADRAPWLRAIAAVLKDPVAHPTGIVVACSALKRTYRDALRSAHAPQFIFLDADRSLIERRFADRPGHFMPASLIASQFDALERPGAMESEVLTIDAALPLEEAVESVLDLLHARRSAANVREHSIPGSRRARSLPRGSR